MRGELLTLQIRWYKKRTFFFFYTSNNIIKNKISHESICGTGVCVCIKNPELSMFYYEEFKPPVTVQQF